MKTNSKKVKCLETGEIFNSCREADRAFGWKIGTAWHVAAGKASEKGIHLEFVFYPDPEEKVYDEELISWMLRSSKWHAQSVKCVETGEIFQSCREADRAFGYLIGTVSRILKGEQNPINYTFEAVDPEKLNLPDPKSEEFKPIPEFPGYSISNFGRVRNKTGKIKSNVRQERNYCTVYSVVLNQNSRPYTLSIRSLYNSAWNGTPIRALAKKPTGLSRKISCITDDLQFSSFMECAEHYHFDYQRFREALHKSDSREFAYKGLEFSY